MKHKFKIDVEASEGKRYYHYRCLRCEMSCRVSKVIMRYALEGNPRVLDFGQHIVRQCTTFDRRGHVLKLDSTAYLEAIREVP